MAAGPREERRSLSQGQVEEEDERGGGAPPRAFGESRCWAPPTFFRGVIGSSTIAVMSKTAWQIGKRRGRRIMLV